MKPATAWVREALRLRRSNTLLMRASFCTFIARLANHSKGGFNTVWGECFWLETPFVLTNHGKGKIQPIIQEQLYGKPYVSARSWPRQGPTQYFTEKCVQNSICIQVCVQVKVRTKNVIM